MKIKTDQNGGINVAWVDQLSLLSMVALLRLHRVKSFTDVYFYKGQPWVEKLLRIICPSVRFSSIEIIETRVILFDEIERMSDENSQGLLDNLRSDVKLILQKADHKYDFEKLLLYFTQELAVELKPAIQLIHHIRYFNEERPDKANHVVLLRNNYWISYIKKAYQNRFDVLTIYPNFRNSINLVYFSLKVMLESLINTALWFFKREDKVVSPEPRIAVFYSHGVNLKKRCDYFWYPKSELKRDDLLLYFKYHNKKPDAETIQMVEDMGIPWINFFTFRVSVLGKTFLELTVFPTRYFLNAQAVLLSNTLKLVAALKTMPHRFKWFVSKYLQLSNDICAFEAFFHKYNIKIHYASYEGGRHLFASNIAIDHLGGVDLSHHWSVLDVVDVDIAKVQDLYFTWGPYFMRHYFRKSYFQAKNFVYSGYPYDYSFSSNKENAKIYRHKLKEQGAQFIISFFDQTTFGTNSMWNKQQEKIWEYLLRLIVANPHVGIIIKPKKANNVSDIYSLYPQLQPLFEEALSTKRCLVLGSRSYPNEAAQASDLTLGVGIASTPCIEAALLGIPAITYNLEHVVNHPFVADGMDKIIFFDFEKLTQTLDAFIRGDHQIGVGDYSYLLNDIDPFRDGGASGRIGFYIKCLLDSIKKGDTKSEAISYANRNYQERYGVDKIYHPSHDVLEGSLYVRESANH